MIGSISKIKPCARKSYWKYNFCKTVDDVKRVEPNYKQDVDANGLWDFNLDTMVNADSLHLSNPYITEAKIILPKATKINGLLGICSSLCKAKVDAPLATDGGTLIYWNPKLTDFEMDTKNLTSFGYFAEATGLKRLNFAMGKVTNGGNAFMRQAIGGHTATTFESALPNLTLGSRMFYYSMPFTEAKYPVDINGDCIWDSGLEQYVLNGVPQYKYLTLPKLTNGSEMFNNTNFGKETTLSILNSLQSFTSGSHPLSLGIHIDHKYDPEVNIALKKCQNSYITPIEEFGSTLPETVTEDKGWTLTINWNGTKTAAAYPSPSTDS